MSLSFAQERNRTFAKAGTDPCYFSKLSNFLRSAKDAFGDKPSTPSATFPFQGVNSPKIMLSGERQYPLFSKNGTRITGFAMTTAFWSQRRKADAI